MEFDGEYENGKRWNGEGKEFNLYNDLLFEGEYIKGEKKGKGIEYFREGGQFSGEYLNGKRWNGKIEKYKKGKLKFIGNYINGKLIGKEYNKIGDIIFEGEFENGKIKKGNEYRYGRLVRKWDK